MRYQVVVLDQETGGDFDIEEIGWQVHPSAQNSAEFADLNIYMGLCAGETLGSNFEDNYIPGTRTLVYHSASEVMTGSPGDWAKIVLDNSYFFNAAEGNLIIEVTWDSCVDHKSFYVNSWDTGSIRSVGYTQAGAPTNPTGSLSSAMPRLMLTGTSSGALTSTTFGAVKNLCGGE